MLRRNFHGITRGQIFIAILFGMLGGRYIWLPVFKKSEDKHRNEATDLDVPNKSDGKQHNLRR